MQVRKRLRSLLTLHPFDFFVTHPESCNAAAAAYVMLVAGSAAGGSEAGAGGAAGLALAGGSVACACRSWRTARSSCECGWSCTMTSPLCVAVKETEYGASPSFFFSA